MGVEKNQTGGFLRLLAPLAKPILMSVARSIGSKPLQGVGKKIFGGRTRTYKRRRRRIGYA